MPAPDSSSAANALPTPFQLALALVVVRAKPSGSSVKGLIPGPFPHGHTGIARRSHHVDADRPQDYVLELRKHIQPIANEEALSGRDALYLHLDVGGYWKSLWEKAEAKEEALRNRVSHFERQAERLGAELDSLRLPTPTQGLDKKRKRTVGSAGKVTKRGKANDSSIWDESALEKFDGNRITGKVGRTLLRHIFDLHRLLRQETPDLPEVAWIIQQACAAAHATISVTCQSLLLPQPTRPSSLATAAAQLTKEELDATFFALTRILRLLATSHERIVSGPETARKSIVDARAGATHSLADLFRTTLSELSSCLQQLGTDTPSHQPPAKPKPRRAKIGPVVLPTPSELIKTLPAHLTRLLHAFVQLSQPPLSLSPSTTNTINEAILSLLLTRLGTHLYTLTFSTGPRPASLSAEIAASSIYIPTAPVVSTSFGTAANPKAAKRLAASEARYLLPLLERLLSDARASPAGPTPDGAHGSAAMLERLQNTLVRGLFGNEDGGAFGDVMRMPREVVLETPAGRVDGAGEEDAEWVRGRMWEVCGWEVLGREFEEDGEGA